MYTACLFMASCASSSSTSEATDGLTSAPPELRAREMELELVNARNRLTNALGEHYDTVGRYSSQFDSVMEAVITTKPASLNYPFQQLQDSTDCTIATSSDKLFRIYSWDTWTGGTMHFFNAMMQWKGVKGAFVSKPVLEEGDPGGWCTEIFTVSMKDKVYYLAVFNAVYSTKDKAQYIQAYSIDNDRLVDTVKLFKTPGGAYSRIDIDFDMASVMDRPERPLKLIRYDAGKLYIPFVKKGGWLTSTNLVYQQKDDSFEYAGIE